MKKLAVLFLLLSTLLPLSALAANGLEVTTLAWDLPTLNIKGEALRSEILGTNVYCRTEGATEPLITKEILVPQTSVDLGTLVLPDGNIYCKIDVFVQITPTSAKLQSGASEELLFFVEAGKSYFDDPANYTPAAPLNLRLK